MATASWGLPLALCDSTAEGVQPSACVHLQSIGIFAFLYSFYHLVNGGMQLWYYWGRGADVAAWKTQPKVAGHVGEDAAVPWVPTLHLLLPRLPFRKPKRGWIATALCAFNAALAATFGGAVCEAYMRGYTRMVNSAVPTGGVEAIAPWLGWLVVQFLVAVVHENVVEYYWHRLMHLGPFYRTFHKIHHSRVAPEPYDDMTIHPLEAFGYYCILYSPPFLYSLDVRVFMAYMVLMGITGILDHCGVDLSVYGVYDAKDHDVHHSSFNVNFGFPFVWLDILHGTYEGTFLGRTYTVAYKRGSPWVTNTPADTTRKQQ